MLIGYARVSKSDGTQNLDIQEDALLKAGVEPERIYKDLASGRKDDRPGLDACLKSLRSADTLIVWKIDRLGRDLRHLVTTIDELRKKNIGFKVFSGQGSQIDTTTSDGRFVFNLFAALAEFERELIAERTKAGLNAARARGRKGGRPKKIDKALLEMPMYAMRDPKAVATEVAKRLNIQTSTLYSYVNSDGTPKKLGIELINS